MMEQPAVGVISLGCAKNLVDTERMLALLQNAGLAIINDPARADALIVNTCGFIESARQESINTLLEMAAYKNGGRCKVLVCTGCLSERYGNDLLSAMPEIDVLIGVHDYERLPGLILEKLSRSVLPACAPVPRILATPPYRAFLRIADGCNNRCAYCAIPLIRGNLQSVPFDALVREAERLAAIGVTELTLIAQDTSGYGKDLYGKPRLCELLRRIAAIDALRWIRVLYTYPDTVTPELIDTLMSSPKLVRYLDMPLQHINDQILTAMHRRGNQSHIRSVLDYIRKYAPDFILRTTMMVGFPGETEEQFSELTAFLTEYPFDRLGAFAFSAEEGTPAEHFPDQVDEPVRAERLDRLMLLQKPIADKINARRIGKTCDLLIEGFARGYAVGRTVYEAPDVDGCVRVLQRPGMKIGTYIPIRLTGAGDYDMIGEPL